MTKKKADSDSKPKKQSVRTYLVFRKDTSDDAFAADHFGPDECDSEPTWDQVGAYLASSPEQALQSYFDDVAKIHEEDGTFDQLSSAMDFEYVAISITGFLLESGSVKPAMRVELRVP